MGDPITIAVTGKKIFDIGKNIFGSGEESDLSKEERNKYFNGHHDRVRERYTNEAFFRFHVLTDGWAYTPQGRQEIQQIVPNGTVLDAYIKLFFYKTTNFEPFLKGYIRQGFGEYSTRLGTPRNEKITQFKLDVNDNIIFIGTDTENPQSIGQSVTQSTNSVLTGSTDVSQAGIMLPTTSILSNKTTLIVGGIVLLLSVGLAVYKK